MGKKSEPEATESAKSERLPVSEFLGVYQGANSPFGDDLEFPLPAEQLRRNDPHD